MMGQQARPGVPAAFGALIVALVLAFLVGLGIYWSAEPGFIESDEPVITVPPGEVTVTALIDVIDVLLHKPGGYLSNDVLPPTIWLDIYTELGIWCFGAGARSLQSAARILQSLPIPVQ